MLLQVPNVLTPDQVAHARVLLAQATWIDGRVTAGPQSSRAKQNLQLPEDSPQARELGEMILGALQRNALFMSAALPLKIFPPLFNQYAGGHSFGSHVDNAIRQVPGTPHRVRTDLSATLFFVEPDGYEGGELVVEDTYGVHSVKLAGRPHDSLPVDEPAPRQAGDERRAGRVLLLDSKPHPRRRPPDAAVRHGHGHPASRGGRPGSRLDRAAHGRVPQPAETVGGIVGQGSWAQGSGLRKTLDHLLKGLLEP